MGDVGDDYRLYDEVQKKKRAERLLDNEKRFAKFDPVKHTPYHWSFSHKGRKLNFWPSKGFGRYNNQTLSAERIEELLKQGDKK